MAAAAGDFDSDDIVQPEVTMSSPERVGRIGRKSIAKIVEKGAEDRLSSKQVLAQLKFGHGAPGTRNHQTLWVLRFEAFRHAIGQDVDRPFTGDDMVRFFESILDKLSIRRDKPGPNQSTIRNAAGHIVNYGHFRWSIKDGFSMGPHDTALMRSWMAKAIKKGQITTGQWMEKAWIGHATLSRMIRAYLTRALEAGTLNFDVTIAKSLSLVLLSALGARPGEVARSNGYKGTEYMQWRHIHLYIDGDEPLFINLRARVTVEFSKNEKNVRNTEEIRYFHPLDQEYSLHVCPITLLLIHCLRHSLVVGTTLKEVLEHTFAQPDRTVVWLFPTRPVLSAIRAAGTGILLDRPAEGSQLLTTTRDMGLVAGMLGRTYAMAIRNGAARDEAHVPAAASDGVGLTTDAVRASLNHSRASTYMGTTDGYVGGASIESFNNRVAAAERTRGREPRFKTATGALEPIGVTVKMLKDRLSLPSRPLDRSVHHGSGPDDPNAPPASTSRLVQPSPSPPPTRSVPDQSTIDLALSHLDAAAQLLDISTADVAELHSIILPTACHSDERASLSEPEAGFAMDQINLQAPLAADDPSTAELGAILLGPDPGSSPVTPEQFIEAYARHNVVKCTEFAIGYVQNNAEVIRMYSGGSRDMPQPFIYTCQVTDGCHYETMTHKHLKRHEATCTPALLDQVSAAVEGLANGVNEEFACQWEGCTYVPAPGIKKGPEQALKLHVQNKHEFEPKSCEHGCDPAHLYPSLPSYQQHIRTKHSRDTPEDKLLLLCRFPGCKRADKPSASLSTLYEHLRSVHMLTTKAARAPYLPPTSRLPGKYVAGQLCPLGCSITYTTLQNMYKHLQARHGKGKEEAKDLIQFDTPPPPEPTVVNTKRAREAAEQAARQTAPRQKKAKASGV